MRRSAVHVVASFAVGALLVGSSFALGEAQTALEGAVPQARCGKGSLPETGLQGQVPLADRQSGRSTQGYRCNLELVGQYQGEGSSWVSQSYGTCAYMSTRYPSAAKSPGVQVLDVSNPANPLLVDTLTSPAMRGPWESLKVNPKRGLLAAVFAPEPLGNGGAFFDVYDIKSDCRHPRLLNSLSTADLSVPSNVLGHEGNWAPDGMTYWAAAAYGGGITAIDVTNTARPTIVFTGITSFLNHGLSVSGNGNRLYIAQMALQGTALLQGNGLQIVDVSEVQAREPAPQVREVGVVTWPDGQAGQHAIQVSYTDRPYVVFVDESGQGAARIIDISDEGAPRVVAKLKLEIHLPENADVRATDTEGAGVFGYEGHYCEVDRPADPTALACGYFQSGVRVFDIRNPLAPREIAYFNPPAQAGSNAQLQGSEHANSAVGGALTADWCSSPPRFVGSQLWVTCQDNGFLALRFTNNAYPIKTPMR